MKLKKFNQFINEELEIDEEAPIHQDELGEEETYDSVDDFKKELDQEELEEGDYDLSDDDDSGEEFDQVEDNYDEEEGEEEGEEEAHEYKGNLLMQELADKLGVELVNNQIDYNGQKINYYSETEKFHIGKNKFETVEEVLDFLGPKSEDVEEESPEIEEIDDEELVDESRKYIKRF